MMKKWLAVCMCMVLLLSLTACGGRCDCYSLPLPEDADYRYGTEQLELGNLAKAYGYFKDSADPRAAEMLEHFVFVPTKVTETDSSVGEDSVTTYTYDAHGNLLMKQESGRYTWTSDVDTSHTYNYNKNGQVLLHTYKSEGYCYVESYTYDEAGHTISYVYSPISDGTTRASGYTRVYDPRGNLLKEERFDIYDEADNFVTAYSYDEQDRVLTRTVTYYDGDRAEYVYTYADDGSYHTTYENDSYTRTTWYDKEDRMTKQELTNSLGIVTEIYEYRYDAQGNEVYYRQMYDNREYVSTHVYDEQGRLLKNEITDNGEPYSTYVYTYDEAGNKLTYEYFTGAATWGRESFTYDEQGHLLTHQKMGDYGWSDTTYAYDEAGNRIKGERTSHDGTYNEQRSYDEWGNGTTFSCYDISDGWETARRQSAEWALQYYPNGVPDQVANAIYHATVE